MEKTDRRFKRTNRLLQQALVELTLEKGYDAVSIRDLTERADVGYATFFRHYGDKDALLEEVLHSMKDEMNTLLKPGWLISNPEQGCTMLFQFVQGNYELVKVLLNSTNTMTLLRPVQELALQEVMEQLPPGSSDTIPPDVSAGFLISSLRVFSTTAVSSSFMSYFAWISFSSVTSSFKVFSKLLLSSEPI